MVSDFGRSKIINEKGFTTSTVAGSRRYIAPEIIWQSGGSDDDEDFIAILTKESDVYAFSMVGVEVSLFQMVHILVFQGHHHRFYLDNNLTPI